MMLHAPDHKRTDTQHHRELNRVNQDLLYVQADLKGARLSSSSLKSAAAGETSCLGLTGVVVRLL